MQTVMHASAPGQASCTENHQLGQGLFPQYGRSSAHFDSALGAKVRRQRGNGNTCPGPRGCHHQSSLITSLITRSSPDPLLGFTEALEPFPPSRAPLASALLFSSPFLPSFLSFSCHPFLPSSLPPFPPNFPSPLPVPPPSWSILARVKRCSGSDCRMRPDRNGVLGALACSSPAEGVRGGRHKWAADHTRSSFKGGVESGSGEGWRRGIEREKVEGERKGWEGNVFT